MKEEQHIFQIIRELPIEVDFSSIEQFVMAQPITAFQTPGGGGLSSSFLSIKNIVIMISTLSVIGSALILLNNSPKQAYTPNPTINSSPVTPFVLADSIPTTTDFLLSLQKDIVHGLIELKAPAISLVNDDNLTSTPNFTLYTDENAFVMPLNEFIINDINKTYSGCDDTQHVISRFTAELAADNLIDPKNFSLKLSNKGMFINKAKQSESVLKKYVELFESLTNSKFSRSSHLSTSVVQCNCSADLFVDDKNIKKETSSTLSSVLNETLDNVQNDPVFSQDNNIISTKMSTGVRKMSNSRVDIDKNRPKAVVQVLPPFSIINMQLNGSVQVEVGDSYSLSIYAGDEKNFEKMKSEVQDGVLHISGEGKSKGKNFFILMLTMPAQELKSVNVTGSGFIEVGEGFTNLQSLVVSGSGGIILDKKFEPENILQIAIQGSGSVQATNIEAKSIVISIPGSGVVAMGGTAEDVKTTVSGSGVASLDKLSAQTASCYVNGSGVIEVQVNQALDILISGSGLVSYWGNAKVTQSVTGSGMVEKK